jgi:hypothetical protein
MSKVNELPDYCIVNAFDLTQNVWIKLVKEDGWWNAIGEEYSFRLEKFDYWIREDWKLISTPVGY